MGSGSHICGGPEEGARWLAESGFALAGNMTRENFCVVLVVLLSMLPRVRVLAIGWGWDPANPLRPWPRLVAEYDAHRGKTIATASWCGFFAAAHEEIAP